METNELLELLLAAHVSQRAREIREEALPEDVTDEQCHAWVQVHGAAVITEVLQELEKFRTALRTHFGGAQDGAVPR